MTLTFGKVVTLMTAARCMTQWALCTAVLAVWGAVIEPTIVSVGMLAV